MGNTSRSDAVREMHGRHPLVRPVTSGKAAYTDSVTCVSPSECFAVGGAVQSSSFGGPFSPLVFHFDGTKWSIMANVAKPNGYKSADVEEMRCPTATNCVAEGVEIPTGSYFDHVYSQTFNGSTWTVVQMPQPYHDQYSYADTPDLTCSSPSQCVAPVNAAADANGKTLYSPFIELWNGTSWKLLTVAPSVSKSFSEFTDMACVADNNCWATQTGGPSTIGGVARAGRSGRSPERPAPTSTPSRASRALRATCSASP